MLIYRSIYFFIFTASLSVDLFVSFSLFFLACFARRLFLLTILLVCQICFYLTMFISEQLFLHQRPLFLLVLLRSFLAPFVRSYFVACIEQKLLLLYMLTNKSTLFIFLTYAALFTFPDRRTVMKLSLCCLLILAAVSQIRSSVSICRNGIRSRSCHTNHLN